MATRMSIDEFQQWLNQQPDDSTKHDALYQAHQRVAQLEKLNATLAVEIDRMRPVVEAAQVMARSLRRHDPVSWIGTEEALERAVTDYEADEDKT